jgi:hypothetical protein
MVKYNLNSLITVTVNDFYKSRWYVFLEGKKNKYFWQDNVKRGFYSDCIGLKFESVDVPENHTFKDNILFENPEVILVFSKGIKKVVYFKTYEDAIEYANSLTQGEYWI